MLALPNQVFEISPTLHAAKIAQINRVFLFTFFAVDHLMSGDVRKHSFDKVTAIWAGDVPEGQGLCFQLGNLQFAPHFKWNVFFLMIGSDLIHSKPPVFPKPISPVIYSARSCLLRIPSSLSRIRNAANDAPIVLAISRMRSLSSARRTLSP